jgi:DNA-binding winged helix-turn-helix (wHTH) protein
MTPSDLRVNMAARRVWRAGGELHLTPKAFDLLALLVERRPDAVSKREIHERLWPGTFVSEVTLHSLVSEVRRTLVDQAHARRLVRTVHGFGYAFIGDIDQASDVAARPSRRLCGWLVGDAGRLNLFDGENVLGRGADDVIELRSSTVSRRHAAIRFADGAWLEDLGSKNGTFLGDVSVSQRARLADGDIVRFGSLVLTFRVAPSAGAATTLSTSSPAIRDDRESGP